jgi:hypothetical protein
MLWNGGVSGEDFILGFGLGCRHRVGGGCLGASEQFLVCWVCFFKKIERLGCSWEALWNGIFLS